MDIVSFESVLFVCEYMEMYKIQCVAEQGPARHPTVIDHPHSAESFSV